MGSGFGDQGLTESKRTGGPPVLTFDPVFYRRKTERDPRVRIGPRIVLGISPVKTD
jgi:hypothetical protein